MPHLPFTTKCAICLQTIQFSSSSRFEHRFMIRGAWVWAHRYCAPLDAVSLARVRLTNRPPKRACKPRADKPKALGAPANDRPTRGAKLELQQSPPAVLEGLPKGNSCIVELAK